MDDLDGLSTKWKTFFDELDNLNGLLDTRHQFVFSSSPVMEKSIINIGVKRDHIFEKQVSNYCQCFFFF